MAGDTITAQSLFMQADAAFKRGDAGAGGRLLSSSFEMSDEVPGAWFLFGAQASDPVIAYAAYLQVHRLAPTEPHVLTNLGWSLYQMGRYDEALLHLIAATKYGPDLPFGWANLSLVYTALGKSSESIACARKAVSIDPNTPRLRMHLAFAQLIAGQLAQGLATYEARFAYKLPEFLSYPMPLWRGEQVDHLFIVAEQGLGDSIQFGRYIPQAARLAGRVTVCVQKPLVRMFRRWMAPWGNVTVVGIPYVVPTDAQAFCPMMSLPVALRRHDCDSEPLRCRTPVVVLDQGPETHVGIVWAGAPDHDNDAHRSATINDMLGLYSIPGVRLHSLQVGDRSRDVRAVGPLVRDHSDEIGRDIMDTIALIESMDHVVTVDTAVAHLAGTLGKPTHLMLSRHGQDWRWGHESSFSRWYPSMRLYRQERPGDWGDVVSGIVERIRCSGSEDVEAENISRQRRECGIFT